MKAPGPTLSLSMLVLLAACAQPAPKLGAASDADVKAVAKALATTDSCSRTGALDVLVSNMTDDVAVLFADQPAVAGKSAVREFYRGVYGMLAIDGHHEPVEMHTVGDLVVTRGTWRATATPRAGGQPTTMETKYLILFRRMDDGSLKLWRAASNTNAPPAAPAAAKKR